MAFHIDASSADAGDAMHQDLDSQARRAYIQPGRPSTGAEAMETPTLLINILRDPALFVRRDRARRRRHKLQGAIDRDGYRTRNNAMASTRLNPNWKDSFISSRGNEYFCEIDEDYLTDRFNLTGLNTEVSYYQYALDLVTDVFDLDCDDEMREQIEKSARHLYGLVHARYIVTTRGLSKMLEKFKKAEFGKCPRVFCNSHPLLPTGQNDTAGVTSVKLYCAKCEDLYNPKSSRHASIDGAYFGTSFHNILLQVYPQALPAKTTRRYEPKCFGFKVHAAAALMRWQEDRREEMVDRLRRGRVEVGFEEEDDDDDELEDDEEMDGEDFEAQHATATRLNDGRVGDLVGHGG